MKPNATLGRAVFGFLIALLSAAVGFVGGLGLDGWVITKGVNELAPIFAPLGAVVFGMTVFAMVYPPTWENTFIAGGDEAPQRLSRKAIWGVVWALIAVAAISAAAFVSAAIHKLGGPWG
jgi:hypothetical protein